MLPYVPPSNENEQLSGFTGWKVRFYYFLKVMVYEWLISETGLELLMDQWLSPNDSLSSLQITVLYCEICHC